MINRWLVMPRSRLRRLLAFFAALFPGLSAAEGLQLDLPLACVPGESCWIANYSDQSDGQVPRDYRCGDLTYAKHNGTDFAIKDEKVMREGVRVLAAAAGRVRAIRDGVPDKNVRMTSTDPVRNIECGNGVAISHPDGWETQYCHLRQGSVKVKVGQTVGAGAVLGEVGMSGLTEFPHLHLTVRHGRRDVDPFVGEGEPAACDKTGQGLWRAEAANALPYVHGSIFHIGISDKMPTEEMVRAGLFDADKELKLHDPSIDGIFVFVEIFGLSNADTVAFNIKDSTGKSRLHVVQRIDRRKARWFGYAGRPYRASAFPAGRYVAEVALTHAAGTEATSAMSVSFEIH